MNVKIKGSIISNDNKWIYDWLGWDSCCPADIEKVISDSADGETLDVEISSGGGEIIAGSEIYTLLRGYKKGKLNIMISGLAASAASVIAMAGYCVMSPTALMMVHNVSGAASGDYRDMESAAQIFRCANEALAAAYTDKTGMSIAEILKLMDKETWLTASSAMEYGFIDEIAFSDSSSVPIKNSADMFGLFESKKLEKLKNLIEIQSGTIAINTDIKSENAKTIKTKNEIEKLLAEFELLKLKTEEI